MCAFLFLGLLMCGHRNIPLTYVLYCLISLCVASIPPNTASERGLMSDARGLNFIVAVQLLVGLTEKQAWQNSRQPDFSQIVGDCYSLFVVSCGILHNSFRLAGVVPPSWWLSEISIILGVL